MAFTILVRNLQEHGLLGTSLDTVRSADDPVLRSFAISLISVR